MIIIALDPGTTHTAILFYDPESCLPIVGNWSKILLNENVAKTLKLLKVEDYKMAYEMIACYGMPVGREVFETCVWTGRFIEAFGGGSPVYRREVKQYLCNSGKAKDKNVSQALRDRFPATGGGVHPSVGTKKKPGPLYGIKSHMWSALGVAVTFAEGACESSKELSEEAKPLTDQDADVWPRLKIMVRDHSTAEWQGPFDFLGVADNEEYLCPITSWSLARRCTDKELIE